MKEVAYDAIVIIIIQMPIVDTVQIALASGVVLGGVYMAFLLLGVQVLFVGLGVAALVALLISRRWAKIRERGLITLCSGKLRSILLERSILDIFRDIVYFPYITKIVSAYLRIAATKPHPSQIQSIFKELPKEVSEVSNKKGLLSLAPSFVEQVVLPSQNRQLLPQNYGTTDWKWDNVQNYSRSKEQVHEETLQKRIIHFLDGKLGWPAAVSLIAITAIGVTHMKPHRFKKMFLQNATYTCMLLSLIALLVKARKMRHGDKRIAIALKDKQE